MKINSNMLSMRKIHKLAKSIVYYHIKEQNGQSFDNASYEEKLNQFRITREEVSNVWSKYRYEYLGRSKAKRAILDLTFSKSLQENNNIFIVVLIFLLILSMSKYDYDIDK